jgi:hypothetical protein
MFEVHARSPLDEQWEDRVVAIVAAAGKPAVKGTSGKMLCCLWRVPTCAEATDLQQRLNRIPGVHATMHEEVSLR